VIRVEFTAPVDEQTVHAVKHIVRQSVPMSVAVPVLLLTGAVGVGKSTIGAEVSRLLGDAEAAHAYVDLAVIGRGWPTPADDPWNERLIHANLACIWSNFAAAGARRLVLCRVLEDRSLLRHVEEAVPGAEITVVQLHAPLATLNARIRTRETPRDPSWFLDVARFLVDHEATTSVADHVVDNTDRHPADVAAEVLSLIRWLP
jgi:gluconate kinase